MAQKSNLSGKQEPDPREKTRINRAVDIGNMQRRVTTQYKSPAPSMKSGGNSVVKNAAYGNTFRDKGSVVKTVNPSKPTSNSPTSLAGGLGMQGYGNAAKGANLRTPRNATMATRNYQYGEVMGKPAAPKPTPRPAKVTNSGGGGGSFNSAFAAARSAGKSTFSYGGKSYNTKVKGETGSTASSKRSGSSGTSKSSGGLSGFGKAFSSARSAGKSSFSYGGKSYNTKVK